MNYIKNLKFTLGSLLLVFVLAACATKYEYKPIAAKDATAYDNVVSVFGAHIGAEVYYNDALVKQVFGFNLKSAGVVPVQLVIDNGSATPLTILSGARVLDTQGNWWELLPDQVVFSRVNEYTKGGVDGGQLAQRTVLFGIVGGLAGAVTGIVTGTNIGEAAGKGAAIGGAVGASSAILNAENNPGSPAAVTRDFSDRNLGGRVVAPGTSQSGFLYFPAEMKKPVRLRLYVLPQALPQPAVTATRVLPLNAVSVELAL
ncbi:MAG: hypothetical protein ACRCTY_09890 [Candidatus Adiutrix sp.]